MQATNDQMEKVSNSLVQAATDMNSMMRDMVNAALQSVSIMTKGYSDIWDSIYTLTQKQIEQSAKVSQTLSSTTNVNDLVNTQNTMLKSSFDSIMSDMNNLSQLSTRIAQQAAEPVTKQVNATISKISKSKAA